MTDYTDTVAVAKSHNTCVSEHEKYALGATKPGGYAAQGFFKDGQQQPQQPQQTTSSGADEVVGAQFLSERPPWKCSCCKVDCTSRETLLGHAAGVKHKRRARAALGLTGQQQQLNGSTSPAQEAAEQATKEAAAVKDNAGAVAAAEAVAGNQQQELDAVDAAVEQPASKKQKKDKNKQESRKKEKKAKSSKGDEAEAAAAGGSMPQPVAAAEDQEPSSTANNEADGNKQQKKKKKDKSNDKSRGKEQVEQQELDFAPLLAVAQKKLKKKGKLGLKKLEALLKDNANGGFTQDVIKAVKEQLLATAGVQLKGGDTLVWDASS